MEWKPFGSGYIYSDFTICTSLLWCVYIILSQASTHGCSQLKHKKWGVGGCMEEVCESTQVIHLIDTSVSPPPYSPSLWSLLSVRMTLLQNWLQLSSQHHWHHLRGCLLHKVEQKVHHRSKPQSLASTFAEHSCILIGVQTHECRLSDTNAFNTYNTILLTRLLPCRKTRRMEKLIMCPVNYYVCFYVWFW